MADVTVCRSCGAPLVWRPGPGRRARYCSVACRRAVEYARRGWDATQRQAAALEQRAAAYPPSLRLLQSIWRQRAARLRRDAGPRP